LDTGKLPEKVQVEKTGLRPNTDQAIRKSGTERDERKDPDSQAVEQLQITYVGKKSAHWSLRKIGGGGEKLVGETGERKKCRGHKGGETTCRTG